MAPLGNNDIEHLRDLDLMIAYLKDEVSLEKVEQIEQLMEEDELYKFSMEQLSASFPTDISLGKTQIQTLENNMTGILERERDNLILTLENDNNSGEGNNGSWFSNLPPWVKISSFLAIVTVLTLAIVFSLKEPIPGNPTDALMVDEDLSAAQNFMSNCVEESPGIGQGSQVTLESAFMNQFAERNYAEAARQLALFDNNPFLAPNCQNFVSFYLGQSYMAQKNHKRAIDSFEKITSQSEVLKNIKNASYWYLGNIYLVNEDYKKASENFSSLLESNQTADNEHLQSLMEKNYLGQAKEYLVYLADKY